MDNEKPPYVRKKFNISKKVKEARIYSTGMGLYELYVNGQKPTEEYFLPSNNNYNLWLQYQTFDVTFPLKRNDNTIGVLLGDEWARGRFGFKSSSANFATKSRGYIIDFVTDRYEFLLELHILYEDGSTDVINTDKTWKCHESHVVMNNNYDGELQDANLFIKNWNLNDCNEDEWEE